MLVSKGMDKGYGSICRVVWTGAGEGFELRELNSKYCKEGIHAN